MINGTVLCLPRSDAIRHAANYLSESGISVTQKCAPDVKYLLLPIPSFPDRDDYLAYYLNRLPDDLIVAGGNLHSPLLTGYQTVDFLQDPYYLASNAAITADCASEILYEKFACSSEGKELLIIGWGRIGKCLGKLLAQHDAHVTISARKATDLAMIQALGYRALPIGELAGHTEKFDAIINTVPVMILPDLKKKPEAVVIELASVPGISGEGIINARGLPGKMAPKRSGKLIADTFTRLSSSYII